MKYILMNKNTEVLLAELNENNVFTNILEVYNLDYSPLSIYNAFNNKALSPLKTLNEWFKDRGIPSWRKNIEILLVRLNVNNPTELLNKAYGLSLSDQYWLKPLTEDIKWEDINFFTNDFLYEDYLDASLNIDSPDKDISLTSPNNTTDGMVEKAWIIENGRRVLVKSSFSPSRQEPINEWLASRICECLDISFCNYEIAVIDNKIVSKCSNFLNDNEEIITASDIINLNKKSNNISELDHYIAILEQKGIMDARKKMSDMYLIDFLLLNIDRHLKNYGIIRNVETLQWLKVTPIFDTGESLGSNLLTSELKFKNGKYKFFSNTNLDFDELPKYIDFSLYDFSKLDGISKSLEEMLKKYQTKMDINDERIKLIVKILEYRINLVKNLKNNKKI